MKETEKETLFVASAKFHLNDQIQNLDRQTLSRLREARNEALHSVKRSFPWMLPATGIAVVCASLFAFFLLTQDPFQGEIISHVEDIELLASSESIEFYDDLEFYEWLSEGESAG